MDDSTNHLSTPQNTNDSSYVDETDGHLAPFTTDPVCVSSPTIKYSRNGDVNGENNGRNAWNNGPESVLSVASG